MYVCACTVHLHKSTQKWSGRYTPPAISRVAVLLQSNIMTYYIHNTFNKCCVHTGILKTEHTKFFCIYTAHGCSAAAIVYTIQPRRCRVDTGCSPVAVKIYWHSIYTIYTRSVWRQRSCTYLHKSTQKWSGRHTHPSFPAASTSPRTKNNSPYTRKQDSAL